MLSGMYNDVQKRWSSQTRGRGRSFMKHAVKQQCCVIRKTLELPQEVTKSSVRFVHQEVVSDLRQSSREVPVKAHGWFSPARQGKLPEYSVAKGESHWMSHWRWQLCRDEHANTSIAVTQRGEHVGQQRQLLHLRLILFMGQVPAEQVPSSSGREQQRHCGLLPVAKFGREQEPRRTL